MVPQLGCGDPTAGTQLDTCVQRELRFTALEGTKADRPFTSDFLLKVETSWMLRPVPWIWSLGWDQGWAPSHHLLWLPPQGGMFYCGVITVWWQESAQGNECLFPKSQATQKLSFAYWGWVHSEPITVAVKEHVIASRVICLIWSNRRELGAV